MSPPPPGAAPPRLNVASGISVGAEGRGAGGAGVARGGCFRSATSSRRRAGLRAPIGRDAGQGGRQRHGQAERRRCRLSIRDPPRTEDPCVRRCPRGSSRIVAPRRISSASLSDTSSLRTSARARRLRPPDQSLERRSHAADADAARSRGRRQPRRDRIGPRCAGTVRGCYDGRADGRRDGDGEVRLNHRTVVARARDSNRDIDIDRLILRCRRLILGG